MTASAAVAATRLSEHEVRAWASVAHDAAPRRGFFALAKSAIGRLVDRVLAKLAFHDARRYRMLIERVARLAAPHDADSARHAESLATLARKLDPEGIGVWYLARIDAAPTLAATCRHALNVRGGPPRPVVRLLEQSMAGRRVCWFGESGGFEALTAESLISASIVAELTGVMNGSEQAPAWPETMATLTKAAAALQTAVRSHRRVFNRPIAAADQAVSLTFQAVNVVRRAVNRTDPQSVDERLAADVARIAHAAAQSACSAALEITAELSSPSDADAPPHGRLASLARTVDALLARVPAGPHNAESTDDSGDSLPSQTVRILLELVRSLRAWGIQLDPSESPVAGHESQLCRTANDMLGRSAETLEAWAVLHETLHIATRDARTAGAPEHVAPAWATQLVHTVTGQATSDDVIRSLQALDDSSEDAVAGAACVAAIRAGSLQLHRELWKLIQSARSNNRRRVLALQLFWRVAMPSS